MQKQKFLPEFPGKYSVNSGHPVIPNVGKTKNSESESSKTLNHIKLTEMPKKIISPGISQKIRYFWGKPEYHNGDEAKTVKFRISIVENLEWYLIDRNAKKNFYRNFPVNSLFRGNTENNNTYQAETA